MKISVLGNQLIIKENITTVAHFDDIKKELERIRLSNSSIILRVEDSLVINSSLIGYLTKLINQYKITVSIHAGSEILFELLDDLGLAQSFNLKKI